MDPNVDCKFSVVFFEDNSVQVIPKKWLLDDTTCLYPNYTNNNQVLKAVQTKEIPGDDWKSYSVTLYGTYDSLKQANLMANQAITVVDNPEKELEESSRKRVQRKKSYGPDFEMDDEEEDSNDEDSLKQADNTTDQAGTNVENPEKELEESSRKRVRTKKSFGSDFEMDDEGDDVNDKGANNPLKTKNSLRDQDITNIGLAENELDENSRDLMRQGLNNEDKLPDEKLPLTVVKTILEDEESYDDHFYSTTDTRDSEPQTKMRRGYKRRARKNDNLSEQNEKLPLAVMKTILEAEEAYDSNFYNSTTEARDSEPPPKIRRAYSRRGRKSDSQNNGRNFANNERDICCKCSDLVRSMSKRMVQMQQDMSTLIGMLDSVPNNGSSYNDLVVQKREYHDIEYLFPVKSLEELEVVESIIANDPERRNKIEGFIKSFGGKEHDVPVSDILYNVFSNKVAVMFCYEGRNKAKLAAATLGIIQIIRDAILDTCKNSTRNVIKAKMMQWFKDAKKRLTIAESNSRNVNESSDNFVEN